MTPPLPLAEAQQRLLSAVEPLPAETVAVERAVGRYLAKPLVAARTQPAADLSAMDGYAVRADDLAGPWKVVGAHGIAVHRRKIGRRLRAGGDERLGEVAPDGFPRWHGFGGKRFDGRQQAFLRFGQRQGRGHSARQSPLLPPVLASSRTPSIVMPFSSALAMS